MMFRLILISLISMLVMVPSAAYAVKIPPDPEDMHIVLIGPPASGKGTLAEFLSNHYQIPTISTGDLLRTEVVKQSASGKKIQKIMAQGGLVPTNLVIQVLKKRISAADADKGFILDGFPRNTEQAALLESTGIAIDFVIILNLPPEAAVDRISYRRVHLQSGRTYHLKTNPPKHAGIDDITNEPLIQREDDTQDAILNRLQAFEEKTKPVINWYKEKQKDPHNKMRVIELDASLSIEEVQKAILKEMEMPKKEDKPQEAGVPATAPNKNLEPVKSTEAQTPVKTLPTMSAPSTTPNPAPKK